MHYLNQEGLKLPLLEYEYNDKSQYIIYGTGSIAKQHFDNVSQKYGMSAIYCFLDSMLKKDSFCGRPVKHPEELKGLDLSRFTFLLGTLTSKKSMINELLRLGVSFENIVVERDYGSDSFEEEVKNISSILLYPATDSVAKVEELDKKFKYLVPNMNKIVDQPNLVIAREVCDISAEYLKLLTKQVEISEYDLVLVWKNEALDDECLKNAKHVYCIDPEYFRMIDIRILLRLNCVLMEKHEIEWFRELSIKNFKGLKGQMNNKKAHVFGAGPSSKIAFDLNLPQNTIRVVCNMYVNNMQLMNVIKPNVYVITEEEMMTGGFIKPTDKIAEYIENNDCFIVMPQIMGLIFINRYPQCKDKLIMVEFTTNGINFPSSDNMTIYRKAYNVITALALPIASSLSDEIYIYGCDGTRLDECKEGQLWTHNKELVKDKNFVVSKKAREENWSVEYYMKHIAYFEEVLAYGEQLGKKYVSGSQSYIPALVKRTTKK